MSETEHPHPDEQLQELIDGRLGGAERAAVEAHLAECVRCQRLHSSLLATRRLLRATAAEGAPPELPPRIAAALAVEAERAGRSAAPDGGGAADRRPRWSRRWALLAAAAAVLVAVGLAYFLPRQQPAPADAVAELVALHAGVEPTLRIEEPAVLEERLAAALPFRPRVLDLAMMDLRLVGGGTGTVAGAPTAWMVYEGPDGRLLCAMYRGRLDQLPATTDLRTEEPFVFRVYRRGELTVVAWQEGELVCALVGRGDPEAVVALAVGKAMLPA